MKLKIGNFRIKNIQFGEKTEFNNGILTINEKEAIDYINPDKKLKNIKMYAVAPGDSVRMIPVKEVVEPRFRPDGRSIFPGYLGPIASSGEGVLYALKGMTVIAVGNYGGWNETLLDMTGPCSEHTHLANMRHLVFYAEMVDPEENNKVHKKNTEYRKSVHLLAEYVGKSLEGKAPDEWEIYELETGAKIAERKGLPKVLLMLGGINQYMVGANMIVYGRDAFNVFPTLMHPNEILDGALVADAGGPKSVGWTTFDWQNMDILKHLYKEHGKTINLIGVIYYCFPDTDIKKQTDSMRAAQIAETMQADAAVVVEPGGGNLDVDFFYVLAALEDRGIKTVGLTNELSGSDGTSQPKVMLDPKGDAIVSVGNSMTIVELPPMKNIIGDIESIVRDNYPGAWENDPILGPSLRSDGSIIVFGAGITGFDGSTGISTYTTKEY